MSVYHHAELVCPHCGHAISSVKDTRGSKDTSYIRRRRECLNCHQRFGTREQVVDETVESGKLRVQLISFRQLKLAYKAFLAQLETENQ